MCRNKQFTTAANLFGSQTEKTSQNVMNKLVILLIFFILSSGFIPQSKGQTLSGTQTKQIKNQVDSLFQEMVVLAEKLNFDRLSKGVDDTRKAGFIVNGRYYTDYSSLVENVKMNAQGLSRQDISIHEKNITVLTDKIVLLTVSGLSKAFISDGREIAADFKWSFIYEKIDGDWKVIYSHQSVNR